HTVSCLIIGGPPFRIRDTTVSNELSQSFPEERLLEPRRLRELSLPTRRNGCNDFPLKNAAGSRPCGRFALGGFSKTTRTNARQGTPTAMHSAACTEWIRPRSRGAALALSVCRGALPLAKAGLLNGQEATTHHGAIDLLRETAPKTTIHADRRFVDNGRVICSA